ncbi:hypothetical protein FACS189494_00560 [Spirochaetia bacterium]|nr:hypothetical protein FACS189494_00560 [Spirochaetia bacterium]
MKREQKVLVGLLAAILAGALVLAGCEKTVDGPTNYIPVIQPGTFQPPDTAILAPNEATLVAWLADTANVYPEIRYLTQLAGAITVGSGKTLYLGGSQTLNSTARVSVTSGGRLVIYSGTASLNDPTAITNSGGSVVVENGGTLSVPGPASAATYPIIYSAERATYAVGGRLSYSAVNTATLTELTTAVGYLGGTGTLSVNLTGPDKISDIITATGGAYRVEIGGTTNPLADETAAGTITIPANLFLASSSVLPANITGLVINGRLTLASGSSSTLTSVTVNNPGNTSGSQLGNITTTGGLDVTLGGATRDIFGSLVNRVSLGLGDVTQLNSVSFGAYSSLVTGTIAKVNAAITVPADAIFNPIGQFNTVAGETVTYKAGRRYSSFGSGFNSDIDIVISKKTGADGFILNGTSLSIPATNVLELFGSTKVTVPAGFDLAIAGTLRLNGNSSGVASLALTGATGTGGAKITGTGKLVAGKTEIVGGTGGWQAVGLGAANDNTVTIAAVAGSTVAVTANIASSGDQGATLTAGAGASITQLAGLSNNLTIAASTTIDLGGTIATSTTVGAINLTESAAAGEGGKITLFDATSIINVQAGASDAGASLSGAQGAFVTSQATGKITASSINSTTGVNIVAGSTTTGRVNRITGSSSSSTLQAYGGTTPGTPVAINASTAL